MRVSILAALLIAAFSLPVQAELRPVKGVAKGTATVAKGVASGAATAGRGVARGTVTAGKATGHGLRCVFTLGTRC